jgi:voltage-gated potassium channel
MWIFRVDEPRLGRIRVREWRRRARHTLGLLLLLLGGATAGLILLDESKSPFLTKAFNAFWDGVNLITTVGDFSEFNDSQKSFMLLAMLATLVIGGFAVSRLTGMLSGDDVMAYRENRIMERKLEHLTGHIVVVGYHSLGSLVADRLRDSGQTVLVLVGDELQAERAADHEHMVVLGSPDSFDDVLKGARLDSARALVVTTPDSNNNLAITLLAHTLNPSLPIAVPGENPFRKGLLENAGASNVIVSDEIIASALVGKLTTQVETRT